MTADGLVVTDVTVRFGGLIALDHVSMEVQPGEVVGVIGPNGAGKTTLFNVVCGFVRPDAGHLSYRGHNLRGVPPHRLRSLGIGRTLQGLGLWPGLTVIEHLLAGWPTSGGSRFAATLFALGTSDRVEAAQRASALELLDDLGLADMAHRLPGTLPFALQKRVSLARALIARPSLLLLDEPASGLSPDEMDELGARVRRLRGEMGILLVEHHMDLVMSVSDRVVVLDFGQVIASGSPAQVQADPVVTAAYLGEEVGA